jgi:Predicted glycosyltransferases
MNLAAPRLAVILVNWNRSNDTLNCLESINASTLADYVVIVVDNGSRVEEIQKLRQVKFNFVLLETGENLGYTGGNNRGIEHALQLNADYLLLLNNDTFIAPDTLQNLMRAAASDRRIGILTPKILFHPARHLIWSAGTFLDRRYMMGYLTGYKSEDRGQFDQPHDLDYASGCAMVIQSGVVKDVGLLCDDYFAICEDIDYCLRAKDAGYRIRYEPSALVWHIESASSGGQDAPQYVYYQTRNYFLFHARWTESIYQLMMSQGFLLLHAVKRTFLLGIRGRWRSILGILYGMRDALLGKLGRREYRALVKT